MAVDVEYARRGDISIAYQAIGDGPVDILFGAGLVSHLDLLWADPYATSFFRRLAGMGRLLLFDKPGTGLSDPVVGLPTLEQRADDHLAVLDAAGSRRAVVIGFSEAAAPALLLAATNPDRVEGVVALSGFAALPSERYLPEARAKFEMEMLPTLLHSMDHWGDGTFLLALSPHARGNALYRRLAPSIERAGASPGMARVIIKAAFDYDVTGAMPAVSVPALVVHRTDEFVPVEFGRDIAEQVPNARYVELPGDEHMCYFTGDDIADTLGAFIGGTTAPRRSVTRKLATVLYTDIVDSTATAARLGDERWLALLASHDQAVGDEIERHDGTLIKTMGDGILATFERPLLGVRCALAVCRRARELGLEVRAGLHAGECEVVGDDVSGIALHIGARIKGLAGGAEVLVSSTVKELVYGSGVEFEDRGDHELKGVPGTWTVHAVIDDRHQDQRPATGAAPAEVALTPAPAATMKSFDRALVGVANRAPMLSRWTLRALSRRPG